MVLSRHSLRAVSYTHLDVYKRQAKGFSDTLNIPMAPILSLDALAMGFQEYKNIIVTMLDARKNQVYAAVYDNTKGKMLKIMAETPLSPIDELASFLAKFPQVKESVITSFPSVVNAYLSLIHI